MSRLYIITLFQFSSVHFSCSVMSDTLQPHGRQHTRLTCPSPTPGDCSNSCPSNRWCHPTISSSVIPFSSCLQSFQHQGLFQGVSSSHQVTKVLEFQLQHQSFQWIFRNDFLYNWLVSCPCSARDSQESSPTLQFKSTILRRSAFFTVQLSHPYMTTGKTIALTRRTFVGKVMPLLLNMLSRLVITFPLKHFCLYFFCLRRKIWKNISLQFMSKAVLCFALEVLWIRSYI